MAERGICQLDRVPVCRSLLPLLGHLAPIRQQYVHDTLVTNLKGQIIAYNYHTLCYINFFLSNIDLVAVIVGVKVVT